MEKEYDGKDEGYSYYKCDRRKKLANQGPASDGKNLEAAYFANPSCF
jgi:hypothetical protein